MTDEDLLHQVAPGQAEAPEALFIKHLARHGLKYTAERRAILQAVLATHAHFDADSLFIAMRQAGAKASKATIYRSLVLLCEVGILRQVFRGQHGAYFEHVYGHAHHEHMICMKCGKVVEFTSAKLEDLQEEACAAHGFQPMRHHLQILGYCRECRPADAVTPTA